MAASEATKRVHTKKSPPPMAAAGLLGPYLVLERTAEDQQAWQMAPCERNKGIAILCLPVSRVT